MRRTLVVVALVALAFVGGSALLHRQTAPAPIKITGTNAPGPIAAPIPAPTVDAPPPPARAPFPTPISPALTPPAPKPVLLYVHVAGAVKHPSLYQLPPGSRVWHAVQAAGGTAKNADTDAINLAEKVHDGEKIYVPTRTAAHPTPPPAAPEVVSSPTPVAVKTASAAPSRKGSGAKPAASAKPTKLVSPSQGQVNINTASAETLQELPGIGPAMAGRIIGYRQQAGGFQKIDDLMNVGGIGPKKFARLAPLVKLR